MNRQQMSFRAFSVPKHDGQPNEDSHQCSKKGIFAISDGAGISFDSASWSKILVTHYAREPEFSPGWISAAISKFTRLYDRESLPWMKQAAFDRGSFASLLGVRIFDRGRFVKILAIGDSLAVLCDGDEIRDTHPYNTSEQFYKSPQLLSTSKDQNAFLSDVDVRYDLYAH
jgi:serine/threonine protein phosphatase PrpC